MLAYDYPLLGMFWTLLWFFLWIAWIWLMIQVVFDIFRSHDMGGFAKADAQAADAQMRTYVRDAAGTPSAAEEISKLASLRDQGILTDDEFQSQKAKLLTA